jgi:hypothetical protein
MPPRSSQYEESIFSHITRGFFFAVGFTPVFVVMCALSVSLFTYMSVAGLNQANTDKPFRRQVANVVEQSPPVNQFKQVLPQLQIPVAEISPSHALSVKDQHEKECNLAILQFSQTNSEADKARVNKLCPE